MSCESLGEFKFDIGASLMVKEGLSFPRGLHSLIHSLISFEC